MAQIEALEKAGCERVHKEYASGSRWDRPELQHILRYIQKGDVLMVWKLDRLTRFAIRSLRV
jgi:DNA invertase Pin-like site-specific DNA recombinase